MRVERFKAATLRGAMKAVKEKLGEDAVILHSKSTNDTVEIIAAVDEPQRELQSITPAENQKDVLTEVGTYSRNVRAATIPKKTKVKRMPEAEPAAIEKSGKAHGKNGHNGYSKIFADGSSGENSLPENGNGKAHERTEGAEDFEKTVRRAEEFSKILHKEMSFMEHQRQLWLQSQANLDKLRKEIAELRQSMLQQELASLKEKAELMKKQKNARKAGPRPSGSKNREQFYRELTTHLEGRGIPKNLIRTILKNVRAGVIARKLNLNTKSGMRGLKDILSQEIMKMIPVSNLEEGRTNKQRVVALVGPPGAGKTTTGLKLAIKNSLIQNKNVAMVLVSDSVSATAKHLELLAKAANLPLAVVETAEDLVAAIKSNSDKDMIVIDFAMRKARDKSGIPELHAFLKAASPGETHLVIPMTLQPDNAVKVANAFKTVHFNHIILSKIDKMQNLGGMLKLFHATGKPLSYLCNGTSIPDNIEPAVAEKPPRMILKG
ncbi:MAG: hypothetical protein GXO75_15655 [Calditrichaeota bacterium]|nr:hypothetical protein [Calditrichota bacterium]